MREAGATLAAALLLAACSAAPPPVANTFDRGGSEPAAARLADAMIAAAGGAAAWSRVRELGWLQATVEDGALKEVDELVWDRSGSRLRHVTIDGEGTA